MLFPFQGMVLSKEENIPAGERADLSPLLEVEEVQMKERARGKIYSAACITAACLLAGSAAEAGTRVYVSPKMKTLSKG